MKVNTYFALSFAALVFASAACSPPPAAEIPPAPQAVRVAEVRLGPISKSRSHLAEVVAKQSINILARVPGTIVALPIAEGSSAAQGSALARVAAPDVAARVSRVRSERKRAQRERDFACTTLKTDRVLAKSGDLPSIQLDRSERACSSANLAVEAAQAGEREASVANSRSTERAPFAGEVLMHLVDEGQSVMPGMPLLKYVSTERQLRLTLPLSDLKGIEVGASVDSPIGTGHVISIGSQALGPGRMIEVLITMDAPVKTRLGTSLTVSLITENVANASAIPEGALGGAEGAHYIFAVEGEKLHRYDVKIGVQSKGWTAITPALPKGSLVVVGALSSLDSNAPILVVKP